MSDKSIKKVVYTCITDSYDDLFDHRFVHPDWDYICFSDTAKPNDSNRSWQIRPLRYAKHDPTRNNRWHKINPHLLLSKYHYSLYVDANIEITSQKFFDNIDKSMKFAVSKHPEQNCAYKESKACAILKKDDVVVMNKLIEKMKTDGFPANYGLHQNGIIFRQHMDTKVVEVMRLWWKLVRNYSKRDQISLPYVLWTKKFKAQNLKIKSIQKCDELKIWPHNKDVRAHVNYLEIKSIAYQKQVKNMAKELRQIKSTKSWKLVGFINSHLRHK